MISRWSLVGYAAGIIFAVGSFIRYFILFPDEDRMIAYVIMGALICAVSWLYNQNLQKGNDITAIEDYLDDRRKFNED